MGSSQGSTLSADVMSLVDTLPVLAKTLIAGGAAGAIAKTAVAPLERIKILLQVILLGLELIMFQWLWLYLSCIQIASVMLKIGILIWCLVGFWPSIDLILCFQYQTRTNDFKTLGVSQSLKKVLQFDGPLGFYK